MSRLRHIFTAAVAAATIGAGALVTTPAEARLTITLGTPVIEPMPFALPTFVDEGGAGGLAGDGGRWHEPEGWLYLRHSGGVWR